MPIFLPHRPEKGTWPLDLWMHPHSALLRSLSSLFFSFKAPIDFEIKMAVLPSMNLKLASSFPCSSSPIHLSQLLGFLLFPMYLLWRIIPTRMPRKVSQASFITNSFWFHAWGCFWGGPGDLCSSRREASPLYKRVTAECTHKSGPVSLQPPSGNMMCFPTGKTRPYLDPVQFCWPRCSYQGNYNAENFSALE